MPHHLARWRAELALVLNTIIWGATFVVVKRALADVSPLLFLALRFSVATLALLALFRRSWSVPRNLGLSVRGGAVAGLSLFTGYVFQTLGLRLTTAPKSAFLTGLSTAMVPLLSALVYQSRPRLAELAGAAVATAGMGLMTLGDESFGVSRGDFLTILCAIAFAAHIISLGHYSRQASFELLSVTQIGMAALLAGSTCWWVEVPILRWRPEVWIAIAVTGLLGTALAFTVQAWAQQYTTSTRTAVIFALEPVFAWLTSFLLTGETLSGRAATGAFVILVGILLVELKPFETEPHPSK
jgi:drug/metabolite transporter (DMT)-like permease